MMFDSTAARKFCWKYLISHYELQKVVLAGGYFGMYQENQLGCMGSV